MLKVQQLLAQAGEHIELKDDESWKVIMHHCCMAVSMGLSAAKVKRSLRYHALLHPVQRFAHSVATLDLELWSPMSLHVETCYSQPSLV